MKAPVAVVIAGSEPTPEERCLEKIVDFFGIERRTLTPQHLDAMDPEDVGDAAAKYNVLISAAHLGRGLAAPSPVRLPRLLRRAASVFVFGFNGSAQSSHLLSWLVGSPDARIDVGLPSKRLLSVASGARELCGPLSGITVARSMADEGGTFYGVRRSEGFRSLVSADGDGEVFFESRREGVPFFLSAAARALDIDRAEDGGFFDVKQWFSSVVPLVVFLRSIGSGAHWSGGEVSAALIVDDPALKRRYGFLQFDRVLASMKRHDYCTTIAFIPWNWRRTDRRTANIFKDNPDRYSLVMHGCDHTANEFGTTSLAVLNHKLKVARRRIVGHLRRNGLAVSPIMVFPHGAFSSEAAYALKCNNFIAAVNTEVNPLGDGVPATRVRELWDVAIMRYASFPIFTRRYMSHGLVNFAFDSLLGKPCLLVAHHEVFKDEGRELTAFVESLNSLAGGVRWRSVEAAVTRSHLSREGKDGSRCLRVFANQTVIDNVSSGSTRFHVEKSESDRRAITRITCGQRDVDWTWDNGSLRFVVDVPPSQTSVIQLEYADPLGESASTEGARYRIGVGVRRYLTEFRDDYVCRSELLSACAGKATRFLK
jgi:peptidoglycan/xylan/chitin deacetylase (PgdA/CDA1 family)